MIVSTGLIHEAKQASYQIKQIEQKKNEGAGSSARPGEWFVEVVYLVCGKWIGFVVPQGGFPVHHTDHCPYPSSRSLFLS